MYQKRSKNITTAFDAYQKSYMNLSVPDSIMKKSSRTSNDNQIGIPMFLSKDSLNKIKLITYSKCKSMDQLMKCDFSSVHPYATTQMRNFFSQAMKYEELTHNSAYDIIMRSVNEGDSFAKTLKKQTQSGFLRFHSYDNSLKDKLKEYDPIDQKSYQDIFPFDHLPYYANNSVEDYKSYFIPKEKISFELEYEFKKSFTYLLDKYVTKAIKYPHSSEILSAMKGVRIFSDDNRYHGEERLNRSKLSKKYRGLRGRRATIYVGPANERDSVVWDLESNECISISHYLIIQILDQIPTSAMTKSPEKELRRERNVKQFKRHKLFYVRDFKKSGLTMDTDLIGFIADVLEEKFQLNISSLRAFDNINILSNVDDKEYGLEKGKFFKPIRGHGLGSANALTTLIQCIISQMKRERLNLSFEDYASISYNDDLLERIDYKFCNELEKIDYEICKGLNFILKETHTGLLKDGHVFCEEYESKRNYNCRKDIKLLLTVNKQLFAPNIYSAKEVIRSISPHEKENYHMDGLLSKTISDVIKHWGFEFVPEEAYLPDIFGGWTSYRSFNINYSLKRISEQQENLPSNKILLKLLEAEKESIGLNIYNKRIRSKIKKYAEIPSGKIWENGILIGNISIPENLNGNLALLSWDKEILSKTLYSGIEKRYYPKPIWNNLLKRRIEAYRNCKPSCVSSEIDVFNKAAKIVYPNHLALPLKFITKWDTNDPTGNIDESISVIGYEEMLGEDRFLLQADILKQYKDNKSKIYSPDVDKYLSELEKLSLEGHNLSVSFDESITVINCFNMDNKLVYSSYLPQFIASYYYSQYGGVPLEIDENIVIPQISRLPEIYPERNFSLNILTYVPHMRRRLLFVRAAIELSFQYGLKDHNEIEDQIKSLIKEESFMKLIGLKLDDMTDKEVIDHLLKHQVIHKKISEDELKKEQTDYENRQNAIESNLGIKSNCPYCLKGYLPDGDELDLFQLNQDVCMLHFDLLPDKIKDDIEVVVRGESISIFDDAKFFVDSLENDEELQDNSDTENDSCSEFNYSDKSPDPESCQTDTDYESDESDS